MSATAPETAMVAHVARRAGAALRKPRPVKVRGIVLTEFLDPPIPGDQFVWAAYRDPEAGPVGFGSTEEAAIADFIAEEPAP